MMFVGCGACGWRFDYSPGGKRKTLLLAIYPDSLLHAARSSADECRRSLAAAIDPSNVHKASMSQWAVVAEAKPRGCH